MEKAFLNCIYLSIHALVKRATVYRIYRYDPKRSFNPRPREEGDIEGGTVVSAVDAFNPRPREEGDRNYCQTTAFPETFNPRPREEGDTPRLLTCRQHRSFNPRPREEGDRVHALLYT